VKRLLDRFLGLIEHGDRRFERSPLRPAWETISTFFFSLATVNPVGGPHIRDTTDLKRYMSVVMTAAAPTVAASIYFFGWRSLAVVMLTYIVGIVIEMGFAVAAGEEVTEGMFVTCILYPMTLPPTLPFWMAALGIAFGIILGKEVFGGTGKNVFNPAIVGRTFLAVTFPVHMASSWAAPYRGGWGGFARWGPSADALVRATPLIDVKNGAPWPLWDMFIGTTSGSLGETSAVLIVLCGLFLVWTRVANWRLPLATIVSALALAGLMHAAAPGRFASPVYHIMGGGLLFGAFFMVTDPVTCPFTRAGKWVFGAGVGAITIMIRTLSGFPEGIMFAILLMNMFAPVIDDAVLALEFRGRARA